MAIGTLTALTEGFQRYGCPYCLSEIAVAVTRSENFVLEGGDLVEAQEDLVDAITNFTSTSFGYLIATVLPGSSAIYVASLFSGSLRTVVDSFQNSSADIGLFLVLILASITLSMIIMPIRALLYEEFLCRSSKLKSDNFANLSKDGVFSSFKLVNDEHYRYHQFWGAMSLIEPFLALKYFAFNTTSHSGARGTVIALLLAFIEIILVWSSIEAYKRYVLRGNKILESGV